MPRAKNANKCKWGHRRGELIRELVQITLTRTPWLSAESRASIDSVYSRLLRWNMTASDSPSSLPAPNQKPQAFLSPFDLPFHKLQSSGASTPPAMAFGFSCYLKHCTIGPMYFNASFVQGPSNILGLYWYASNNSAFIVFHQYKMFKRKVMLDWSHGTTLLEFVNWAGVCVCVFFMLF